MNQILDKVRQAQRRLFFQSLVKNLPTFLGSFLAIAFVAVLLPKFIPVEFLSNENSSQTWLNSWAWGSVAAGILSCVVWTWVRRQPAEEAAHQIDNAYGLKERVATSLTLSEKEVNENQFASAVIDDTSKRIADVEIRDQFPVQPNRWLLVPVLPALAIVGLSFLPEAKALDEEKTALVDNKTKDSLKKHLKKAVLKKNAKKPELNANSEIDADKILNKKIDALKDKLNSKDLTKKQALMSINDMKDAIKKQQAKLGDSKAFQKMLGDMKNGKSPLSKKIGDAIKNGEFKKANKAIQNLLDKIEKGEMTKSEIDKLNKDVEKLKKQFEKQKQEIENKKADLDRQIKDAQKKGDQEKAAQLQKQKQDLEQQQRQQQQMENICKQCNKLGDALKKAAQNPNGQPNEQQMQQIKEALKDLEGQMQQMQQDQQQAEKLKELMEDMKNLQNEINGNGQGMGQKGGQGDKDGKKPGKGMGGGKGQGERPIEEEDVKFRNSRVRPKVNGNGEVARIGKVGGANKKGRSLADIRKNIENAAKSQTITPDNLQNIPPHQKDHVKEFFKKSKQ